MFHETLLESAPFGRKRKRWPLAVAVTVEVVVCSVFIVLPLLSSGIIPLAAHPREFLPLDQLPHRIPPSTTDTATAGGGGGVTSHAEVVTVPTGSTVPCFVHCPNVTDEPDPSAVINVDVGRHELPDGLANCNTCKHAGPPTPQRVSRLAPGSLIYRVEPVYPRMLISTQARGIVKLHAIIATDGTIQSLSVIEGSPLLVAAVRDAVKQWRYRPYILNGKPVEVETMITVTFKGTDQ